MSERYLQSLAILLAGLFSAERKRSSGPSLGLALPTAEDGSRDAVMAQKKENEH